MSIPALSVSKAIFLLAGMMYFGAGVSLASSLLLRSVDFSGRSRLQCTVRIFLDLQFCFFILYTGILSSGLDSTMYGPDSHLSAILRLPLIVAFFAKTMSPGLRTEDLAF
ncbi:hypothetical protein DPMN_166665 [Dreissena polymorpha]|uniref:Uncharacterized protein n=1 Tax=Dreissena polymorpha TaxID=45954 RepID=A0A9D4F2I6_DREPO|nr:hypothetical protein DPMN_166665 [Dreissena polymorpha]